MGGIPFYGSRKKIGEFEMSLKRRPGEPDKWLVYEIRRVANISGDGNVLDATANNSQTNVSTTGNPSVTNPMDEILPISKKLSEATTSGDRAMIESYLTDDFVYRDVGNRKSMDRAKYLSKIKRDKSIRSYSCHDYELSVEGEQTLLTGICEYDITSLIFSEALHVRQRFTDRFIKRNGNWKLVGIDTIVLPNNR